MCIRDRFIGSWEGETGIPLDGVYTGKALHRLVQAWREDPAWSGQRVLFIHTGGLQGNRSWR